MFRRKRENRIVNALTKEISLRWHWAMYKKVDADRFWRDPYALGFMLGMAANIAQVENRGAIAAERYTPLLEQALAAVCGRDGSSVLDVALSFQLCSDPDYTRAFANAQKVFLARTGLLEPDENDPDFGGIATLARLGGDSGKRILESTLEGRLFQKEMSLRMGVD